MSEPSHANSQRLATIRRIDTALYAVPNEEPLDDATQSFDQLELVVARIETETGLQGVGFTYTIGKGGSTIKRFLDDVLVPRLEGETVAPKRVRANLRADTTFVGREGISEFAIASVDIAVWDLLGKKVDLPLVEVLGGTRDPVPAYQTHGGWIQYDEETLVENAVDAADRGFAGMKVKVGLSYPEDARRVRAVREALPDEMDLMIDANCSYSLAEARSLAEHLDDVAITWFEEPLVKGDYAAHADLRSQIEIPIATGENIYNETQFGQLIAQNAADYLQPDVCRVGGITPWLAVTQQAAANNLLVSPHYIEPIHVHLAPLFENVPYIEHHSTVLNEVVESPLELDEGVFHPPNCPGHGMTFDGIEQYRVD